MWMLSQHGHKIPSDHWFMVFKRTFNNILKSYIGWSGLLVEETGVPGENL
jgi:hypothetical protein